MVGMVRTFMLQPRRGPAANLRILQMGTRVREVFQPAGRASHTHARHALQTAMEPLVMEACMQERHGAHHGGSSIPDIMSSDGRIDLASPGTRG
jgi:hypothetical protein